MKKLMQYAASLVACFAVSLSFEATLTHSRGLDNSIISHAGRNTTEASQKESSTLNIPERSHLSPSRTSFLPSSTSLSNRNTSSNTSTQAQKDSKDRKRADLPQPPNNSHLEVSTTHKPNHLKGKRLLKTPSGAHQTHNVVFRDPDSKNVSSDKVKLLARSERSKDMQTAIKGKTGRLSLSGSSSSPVEPIKPLLDLGSGSSGGLTLPPHPVFDEGAPKNVSGLQGNTAYLHCLVHNLGNKSVSWIRQRDLHILTVGRYTYTTDQRFEVLHKNGSKDWILKIKYAQVRDSGNYECQLSTKPILSYVVTLSLYAAPKAEIIGAPDMHVDRGSTINLTCVIENSPAPPAYIFWYHNGNVVNYDSPRGGITVVTERGNTTRGYLLIQNAKASDSGNYSCEPSNTGKTHLRVHVLDGELPAAMQSKGVKGMDSIFCSAITYILLILQANLTSRLWQT